MLPAVARGPAATAVRAGAGAGGPGAAGADGSRRGSGLMKGERLGERHRLHAVCASAPTGASTSTRTRRRLPLPRAGASVSGNESTRLLPLLPEECHPAVTRATAIGGHHMHSNPTHPSPVLRCSADGQAVSGPELSWENEGGHLRAPRGYREMSSRPLDAEARNRLADEHALLLHQVAARADDVLAATGGRGWSWPVSSTTCGRSSSARPGSEERLLFTDADTTSADALGLARSQPRPAAVRPGSPHSPRNYPWGARPAGASRDRSRAGHSAHRASPSRRGSPVSIRDERGRLRWSSTRTPGIPSPTDRHQPRCLLGRADHRRGRLWRPAAACVQQPVELVGSADPQQLCSRLLRDSDIVVRYLTDGHPPSA